MIAALKRLALGALLCWSVPAYAAQTLDGTFGFGYCSTAPTSCSNNSRGATTSIAGDVLIYAVQIVGVSPVLAAPTVTGVTGCSLTWAKMSAASDTNPDGVNNSVNQEIWYALPAGTVSGCVVTGSLSTAGTAVANYVFGISASNVTVVSDHNANLPDGFNVDTGGATTAQGNVTTINANDFMIGMVTIGGNHTVSISSSFTNIDFTSFATWIGYKVLSSTLTNATFNVASAGKAGFLFDAVCASSGSCGAPAGVGSARQMPLLGVGN